MLYILLKLGQLYIMASYELILKLLLYTHTHTPSTTTTTTNNNTDANITKLILNLVKNQSLTSSQYFNLQAVFIDPFECQSIHQ